MKQERNMTQIQVKLDTSANPPVTVQPQVQSINRGNSQIQWTPFASQNFTFVSLTGLPNPPFSGLSVTSSSITVQDDNTVAGDYTYTITVSSGGNNYDTNGTISADPPGRGHSHAKAEGLLGGGGSPTIKNN
jgi:hypothetical protein